MSDRARELASLKDRLGVARIEKALSEERRHHWKKKAPPPPPSPLGILDLREIFILDLIWGLGLN